MHGLFLFSPLLTREGRRTNQEEEKENLSSVQIMGVAIIAGVVVAVIAVALCAAGFWFYRAYNMEKAKKTAMAGKWSGAYSTGNSTASGASRPPAAPPV